MDQDLPGPPFSHSELFNVDNYQKILIFFFVHGHNIHIMYLPSTHWQHPLFFKEYMYQETLSEKKIIRIHALHASHAVPDAKNKEGYKDDHARPWKCNKICLSKEQVKEIKNI
jgi:hypothetical protein